MKRFYKFLMPLVAIVALALPLNVAAQTTCQIKIVGEDGYADGWNGGSLAVVQGGTTVATFNAANADNDGDGPELDSTTVTVNAAPVSFVWTSGDYDDEVTIWIYGSDDTTLLFTVNEPDAGTIFSMGNACSTNPCPLPTGLAASVLGDNVDFTWAAGTATSWDLVWGIGDFDPDTVTVNIASVTTNSYTLYGADSGMYNCYLRADCGSGDYSGWISGNFSIGVLIMNMATSGTQTISSCNATIYDDGGPTATYSANCQSTLIITPASADSWVSVSGSSYTEGSWDYLRIYDGVGTSGEELWTDYGVSTLQNFGPFQSSAITVVFQSDGSVYYDGFQINVTCVPAPACPRPAGLTVGYVSTDTVELYWDDPVNSNWQIVYGLAGFDPDTAVQNVITTTDTSIFITGLDINTQYDFYLMAICDDNTLTASRMASARTLAGLPISQFPYFCGFELTDDGNQASDWVLENGTQANYWVVDSATNNGGVRSMYITNDGSANGYNTGSTSYVFAYANFMLEAGEYAYSYDWKAYGESCCDFIRAAVVPATVEFTSGDYCGFSSSADVPAGGIAIDGAGKLNLQSSWQTQSGTFTIANSGVYRMVFMWRNDGSVGTQPPAAIDNIQVVQNTCPAPRNLTATLVTPDSIAVAWQAGGEETTWEIAIGNEDPVEVNDSAYVFDNLNANTIYAIRVRGICGADDTSMWATLSVRTDCGLMTVLPYTEDFENVGTTSSTAPNITFIPCWTRLDNGTTYRYPYISSSTTYNHTDGGSTGLYWYATTTTGTYGDYQIIVLPGVDTTEIPMNTTMLTFWAKPSSSGYSVVFYVGVMTDPTADSTFQYYDTIALPSNSTNWAKYTVMLDGFTGTGNHVAIRANRSSSYWTAYVDDITLDVIPDCPAVEDLNTLAGPASAMVSWNVVGNGYTGALVEYKSDSVDTWNSINVTGDHYAAITGLDPETSYSVRVSAVCGDATSNAVNGSFLTTSFGCAVMDLSTSHFDTITGTTPATSYQRPVNNYYRNTFSEQIYDSTELGAPGPIVAFSLDYGYSTPMADKTNCQVYMANTPLSTISTSNYVLPTNMTLVYSGSLNCVNGWNEFQLTAPFTYTGGNLAVAVIDNSNEYDGNAYVWNGHTVTGKSFSWYSDSYTYPNSSMSTNTDAFRPNMAFSFVNCIQQSTCAAPLPVVTEVTSTTTNVAWAPGNGETSWNVYYRQVGENNWSAPVAVTTTSYTFTGLNSGMNYEFKVENVCGTEILSNTVSATTLCATISSLPFNENFNSWGAGSGVMPNCWYRTGTYSTYTYISSSYNRSGATGGSIYMYQSGSNHSTIFLPALDTNVYQANQTQLVFHVMNTTADYLHPGFEVGVLSDPDDISTFVPVDTVFHTVGPNIWEIFEVPLSGYTGNGAYVGFRTVDNPASGTQYTYTYPYLDDFTLELIPTCPRPDSLTSANATTNSVDLGWHERGGASSWIIEYGPRGFELGTGTVVSATSNPFTLTGLPAAYQGEYYVRSVCSSTDTGDYSRMPCAFGTSQIPATLPYNYDYENVAEWNNWQTSTNHATANWYRGTDVANGGSYSMYIAHNDTGYFDYTFNAVVNAAIYRDIDFGTIDSSFTISFDARVGGSTTASYDGLMVFLVDPSIAPVPSPNNITSPWGNVNDLYRIATVRLDTTWQTYEASFDTIHGIQRVAFFWFNQNTASSYANIPEPAAVDNIHIDYSSCPRPLNLEASVVGSTNATLTWTGAAGADYEVVYRVVGGSNMTTVAHTNAITLTGLNSNTTYRAWVRKICGAGDTSLYADGVEFMTTLCEGGTEALNYDPTTTATTSSYSPIGYATYNYSYVQTIIDSAYLATLGGDISAFAFYPTTTTASDYYTNMTVYMANVSESDLSSGFILPDATHEFYKVIDSANFNFTNANEWQIHNLDTAFTWDGHSNVLFAVNREHGTWTSSTSFSAHTATAPKMRYAYQDSGPYDYTTISGGYTSTIVGDIRFISCGSAAPCEEPVVLGIDTAETTISINWTGTANNYEVAIVDGNTWIEPAAGTIVADTFYTFTGLTGQTDYTIGVRAICGSRYSAWTTLPVTTLRHPCAVPTGITVTDNTYDGATVSWTAGEAETDWQVRVFCASPVYDNTIDVSGTPSVVITGLANDAVYSVAVRAVCDSAWMSLWSDTVALTPVTCPQVTGVGSSNVTFNAATITWNPSGADSYELEYGNTGFQQGSGHTATSNTASFNLTGLEEMTTYDVFVRSVCATGVTSEWSAKYTFTTPENNGIDDVAGSNVTLFPNPASTMVTIRGIEGESTVTVVDLNGREVYKTSANDNLTIDLTGYAKGAYFVRITGERTTAIRKLIVK